MSPRKLQESRTSKKCPKCGEYELDYFPAGSFLKCSHCGYHEQIKDKN